MDTFVQSRKHPAHISVTVCFHPDRKLTNDLFILLILLTLSVKYFDQLLGAARQVYVVYLAQLLGAVLFIHFISNHDTKNIVSFSHTHSPPTPPPPPPPVGHKSPLLC